MAAKRTEYQIVGRYMNGKEVTGYHLQSIDTGKAGRYTKEQVCYLVGRGQITNCTGQLYQDKVLLRGNGMSLEDLPVQYEDGGSRNMEQLGRVRKGTSAEQAMTQFLIVGAIKSGRNTVGYVIQNAGSGIKKVKRQQVIELAQAGRIGNARVQNYNGKLLLRGVGCNLDTLPVENIAPPKSQPTSTPEAPKSAEEASGRVTRRNPDKIYIVASQLFVDESGAVKPYLIDFESGNRDKLIAYCKALASKGYQTFSNNGLNMNAGSLGPDFVYVFDDAMGGFRHYVKLARQTGAIFMIAKNPALLREGEDGIEEIEDNDPLRSRIEETIKNNCNAYGISRC